MAEKRTPLQFESWGRYPSLEAEVIPLAWRSDFPSSKLALTRMLPVGLGRSYGDVCLLEGGALLKTVNLDRFLAFDPNTGILRCEAGVSFAEILRVCLPKGWFPPVTPGTKYVTVGGAIANDVHGKNHHVAGTFGCHVLRFELVRSDGSRMECSATKNANWFHATIAGIGLTGMITWADIQLRRIVSSQIDYEGIQFHGPEEFFALSEDREQSEYCVAWLDCNGRGKNFFRGIFMKGRHSENPAPLMVERDFRLQIPCLLPTFCMNRLAMQGFNALYFRKQRRPREKKSVSYSSFFYPLDAIQHWNRAYGSRGALQFQCVLPLEVSRQAIVRIVQEISNSSLASPLAVLKIFGDVPSPGLLSFPMPGVTLAVDLPIRGEETLRFYDHLLDLCSEYGGRVYAAKDARMRPEHFQSAYPNWEIFSQYVDPLFHSSFWQRVTAHG